METNILRKYAEAIVQVGINLKPGENVQIKAPVESLDLVREIVSICWKAGAADVETRFSDAIVNRSFYLHGQDEVFDTYKDFKVAYSESLCKEKYHIISISCPNMDLYRDVDNARMQRFSVAANLKTKHLSALMDKGDIKWVVAACATPRWAKGMFPELSEEEGMAKLWELIFQACRISEDEDAVQAWQMHDVNLKKREAWLDAQDFEYLHYAGPGTDLKVYIAEKNKWIGGSSVTPDGDRYIANIPTEEIFACPHMNKVDGRLQATKPLALNGKIVEDFYFVFKDGAVTEFHAAKNEEALKKKMETDEGAVRLGEVALVPDASPISRMGVLFSNTLFDENASCHFALGSSYAETIVGGEDMTAEERQELGANDSMIHIDFMVGSDQLQVTGYKKDGTAVAVLRNGNWAEEL